MDPMLLSLLAQMIPGLVTAAGGALGAGLGAGDNALPTGARADYDNPLTRFLQGNDYTRDLRLNRDPGLYGNGEGSFTKQLGSAQDNINSLLDLIRGGTDTYNQKQDTLQGRLDPYAGILAGLGGRMADYTSQFDNLAQGLAREGTGQLGIIRQMQNPDSYLRYMTNLGQQSTKQAEDAFGSMFGAYQANADAYTRDAANRARSDAASQMAASGLLNSGAALDAISGAGVNEQLKAAAELAALRGQQVGQTYNGLMNSGSSAYGNLANVALGALGGITDMYKGRGDLLTGSLNSLGSAANAYGNSADVIKSLIDASNSQFGSNMSAWGTQLNSNQNTWANLLSAIQQDQQYEFNSGNQGGFLDFLRGQTAGSGQQAGMNAGSIQQLLTQLFGKTPQTGQNVQIG